jgi:hypothetical protein
MKKIITLTLILIIFAACKKEEIKTTFQDRNIGIECYTKDMNKSDQFEAGQEIKILFTENGTPINNDKRLNISYTWVINSITKYGITIFYGNEINTGGYYCTYGRIEKFKTIGVKNIDVFCNDMINSQIKLSKQIEIIR